MEELRHKFVEQCKCYFGVPYSRKYWAKDSPEYNSPVFLDCCGLVRQVARDLQEDLGFRIGPWNQAYMFDTLPIVLQEADMRPGDLVFMSGNYVNPKNKKQRHDMVHVEVWLGEGRRTIGARWNNGKVQVFDSYRFQAKSFREEQYYFRSIDTWLMGLCKSHCDQHPWGLITYTPGKKSIFFTQQEHLVQQDQGAGDDDDDGNDHEDGDDEDDVNEHPSEVEGEAAKGSYSQSSCAEGHGVVAKTTPATPLTPAVLHPSPPDGEGAVLHPSPPDGEGAVLHPSPPDGEGAVLHPSPPDGEGAVLHPSPPDGEGGEPRRDDITGASGSCGSQRPPDTQHQGARVGDLYLAGDRGSATWRAKCLGPESAPLLDSSCGSPVDALWGSVDAFWGSSVDAPCGSPVDASPGSPVDALRAAISSIPGPAALRAPCTGRRSGDPSGLTPAGNLEPLTLGEGKEEGKGKEEARGCMKRGGGGGVGVAAVCDSSGGLSKVDEGGLTAENTSSVS